MRNVTKLAAWPELEKLGFIPIRFRAHGNVVAIGAALQREHVSITGEKFKSDIITIEPHDFKYHDSPYHITGEVKTPFIGRFYRYEGTRKVELYEQVNRINEFYSARDILKTVHLMLK